MQYTKEKLKAQQMVLFHLGYYKGLIDGIWAPASIEAKRQFESDPSFVPGNPNGGLPFGERDRLPKGMVYERGLVVHTGLDAERRAEIEEGMKKRMAASTPKIGETEHVQHVEEVPFTANPASTEKVEKVEAEEAKQPEKQEERAPKFQHQHGKHKNR